MSRHAFSFARRFLPILALVAELFGPGVGAQSVGGGFDPSPDGTVFAIVRQPDGRIIVGGSFAFLRSSGVGEVFDRSKIARINTDGTVDPGFQAGFNGDVTSLVLQPDGRIVVAGRFTTVQNAGGPLLARNGLARLNADGTVDPAFDPNPSGHAFPLAPVRAMLLQADGRIVVGGAFTAFQPGGAGATITRNRLARLNADGTVDPTFDPNVDNVVLALALQRDGRILAGGAFTEARPNGAGPTAVGRLARFATNGTLDAAFLPEVDERVLALAVEVDGSILLGGEFRAIRGVGAEAAATRVFLARLRPDGALDPVLTAVPSGPVGALALQPDGRILVGGRFATIYSPETRQFSSRPFAARLDPTGAVDAGFAIFPSSVVNAFLVQPDNSVVLGGAFASVVGTGATTSQARRGLARVQANGALDSGFVVDGGGSVATAVRQPDGRLLLGGAFNGFAGVPRTNLVRISADGSVDPAFNPAINGSVATAALQADGRIVIGGGFTRVNGVERLFIARLNADGTLDASFNPRANGGVERLVVHTDGKIYAIGQFSTFTPNATGSAIVRNSIARLNSDGTVDADYDPNPNSLVLAIAVQNDGSALIGGIFSGFRPGGGSSLVSVSNLARLTPAGRIDDRFAVRVDSSVSAITFQPDGRFLLGGSFANVIVGSSGTATARGRMARFNADGTLDAAFNPNFNATVSTVSVLADGRIFATGAFTELAPNGATTPVARERTAWIEADGTIGEARAVVFNGPVSAALGGPADVLFVGGFSRVSTPDGVGRIADAHVARFTLAGAVDPAFRPAGGGALTGFAGAIAVDPDGRLVVGGSFDGLNGSTNRNLTRLGADGSPDLDFFARPDGPVNAVVVRRLETSSALVGGPAAVLNASGTFLDTFSPTQISSLTGSVRALVRQSDGKLVVGGDFVGTTSANPHLVRFNPDGTIDPAFNPAPDLGVNALALQPDGKLLVGGTFTSMGGVSRSRLARLNADGTLDTAFNPTPNGTILRIVVQSDGRILIGGSFSQLQPNGAATSTARANLARLNADGTLDTAFNPSTNAAVDAIAVQPDGKILVGGAFNTIGSTARTGLARLEANGNLETAFNPSPDNRVSDIALQSDGKILVGGAFLRFSPNGATTPVDRFFLARVNTDGTLDDTFRPSPDNVVSSIAVQADGRILVGGAFSFFLRDPALDPVFRNAVARLNADGTIDPSINPIPDGAIRTVQAFPDGTFAIGGDHLSLFPDPTLIVGGDFTAFSQDPVTRLARLYRNGIIDVRFTAAPNAAVFALAQQPDERLIVAGAFTEISGTPRLRLARMNLDGVLDPAFTPAADAPVRTAAVLPGGRIVVGGEFSTLAGVPRGRLGLLEPDGSIVASFTATLDGAVNAVVGLPDGGFLVGGEFQMVNGAARAHLARLRADGTLDAAFAPAVNGVVSSIALLGDGRVMIGGAFTQVGGAPRRGLARLQAGGALDASFALQPDDDVLAIAAQQDGGLVVGGRFSSLGDRTAGLLGAISGAGGASQRIAVEPSLTAATYTIGGTAGDFAAVRFQSSTDFTNWTDLGVGQRTGAAGAWRITGLALPADSIHYLRVIGTVAGNRFGSVSSRVVAAQFFGSTAAGTFAGSTAEDGSSGSSGGGSSGGGDGGSGVSGPGGGSGGAGGGGSPGDPIPGGGANTSTFGVSNLSSRGWPSATEPLIAGFVVAGSSPQTVLLRGVGPGLAPFGVADTMPTPALRVYDGAGALLAEAGAWGGAGGLASTFGAVGAFPLDPASTDAAVALTLAPGAYTVHVNDAGSQGGVALNELYLVAGAGVANVSVRGPAASGNAALIAGFVVDGTAPRRLLVRGVGPGLARFGVAGVIVDPAVRVYDSDGLLVAANDDWAHQAALAPAEMAAQVAATGAFALPADGLDAAVFVTLAPGAYTVHLTGPAPGAALIEIYAAP